MLTMLTPFVEMQGKHPPGKQVRIIGVNNAVAVGVPIVTIVRRNSSGSSAERSRRDRVPVSGVT